jgi:hypothetical protein
LAQQWWANKTLRRQKILGLWLIAALLVLAGCSNSGQSPLSPSGPQVPMVRKDINDVLRQHDRELMAIPGVVGVAVGLMPDDRTYCLKVLVVKLTNEIRRKIPASIDGYPVALEESGVIQPLRQKSK